MRDPEIVFEIRTALGARAAEPLSFRNDFTGTHQDVYLKATRDSGQPHG